MRYNKEGLIGLVVDALARWGWRNLSDMVLEIAIISIGAIMLKSLRYK